MPSPKNSVTSLVTTGVLFCLSHTPPPLYCCCCRRRRCSSCSSLRFLVLLQVPGFASKRKLLDILFKDGDILAGRGRHHVTQYVIVTSIHFVTECFKRVGAFVIIYRWAQILVKFFFCCNITHCLRMISTSTVHLESTTTNFFNEFPNKDRFTTGNFNEMDF